MNTGYVKAVLGDAKDHGFRGTINFGCWYEDRF